MHVIAAHIDIPPELAGSLAALVISVLVVLCVWMVRGGSGGKQTRGTVPRPGAPIHTCGLEAKWMLPRGPWHCDRCNVAVQPGAPPAAAQPQGPVCPTCGGPGRWLHESNAWGCDRCRMLIPPPRA